MRSDWRGGPAPGHEPPRGSDRFYNNGNHRSRGGGGGAGGGGPPPHSRGGYRRSRSRSRSVTDEDSHSSRSYSTSSSVSDRSRDRSHRSRSRSSVASHSRSPSRSRSSYSGSEDDDDDSRGRERSNKRARTNSGSSRRQRRRHRSRSYDSYSSHSSDDSRASDDDDSSMGSSSSEKSKSSKTKKLKPTKEEQEMKRREMALTKDQRTVFVSQLIMRTTESDLKKYFKKQVGCKVNEVILLKDKRTGRHKGCAYIELGRLEDIPKAIAVAGQAPDFQRFPILIKGSEAEKNYVANAGIMTGTALAVGVPGVYTQMQNNNNTGMIDSVVPPPMSLGADGKPYESQRAYIGNLDRSVTAEHLQMIFSQFGQLVKIHLQIDPATGVSRGFTFLHFMDPMSANLAIQTMSGQILVGRPM